MTMNYSCTKEVVADETNPLLEEWTTEYGIPPFDKIKAEHFAPAFEVAIAEHKAEIDAIVASDEEPTFENTIVALDNAGIRLSEIGLIFGMLSSSDLTPEMEKVQDKMTPILEEHFNSIMLNDALFKRVKAVYDQRNTLGLDAVQLRLVEKTYNEFVRSGALLEGEAKERLKQINAELAMLSVDFNKNLLAENGAFTLHLEANQVAELPDGVKAQAREAAEAAGMSGYLFTLDKPSMLPFLTYSSNRDLRREIYNGYLMRCNNDNAHDNKEIVEKMTALRIEKAHLLGYDSYAAYVTADQMAGTPEAAYELLEEIFYPAVESAQRELEDMKIMFEKDYPGETFEMSDWWYYAEKVRKQKYQLDEEAVRPYLSLDNVREGMFYLANRLYGVTFRPITAPRYHKECTVYQVLDHDQTHLGVLYIDPHPRRRVAAHGVATS